MVKYDFKSVADNNGFIRLANVKNIDKFVDVFKRMSFYNCINPNDSLYKDYSAKTTCADGTYDFAQICQADMFLRRVMTGFPTGWIAYSYFEKCGSYSHTSSRSTNIVYVYRYEYCNKRCANMQSIRVCYQDVNGQFGSMVFNIDELQSIVFKFLNADEIRIAQEYAKLLKCKPTPIYEFMIMKQLYKDDYAAYVADCKKYGFKILDKALIERINIEYEGTPTTFTRDGILGWKPNDDVVIVNAE